MQTCYIFLQKKEEHGLLIGAWEMVLIMGNITFADLGFQGAAAGNPWLLLVELRTLQKAAAAK